MHEVARQECCSIDGQQSAVKCTTLLETISQHCQRPSRLAGSLIFVDFGMMSEISSGRRDSLVELFYAVYRADADGVLAALIDLNIIVPTADALSLRRAIAFGLDNLMRKVICALKHERVVRV